MSLLDGLSSGKNRRVGASCSAGIGLAALTGDEALAIRAALAGPLNGTTIAAILRANGHPISDNALQRHRRGGCQCQIS